MICLNLMYGMKHKSIFFHLLIGLVILSAFKIWNTSSMLTSSPWTSVENWDDFDGNGTFVMDTIQCHNDNHWIFSSNGNLLITEGLIACDLESPWLDSIPGQWTLTNNDTRLKIDFTGGEMYLTIADIGADHVVFFLSGTEDPNDMTVRQRIILHR